MRLRREQLGPVVGVTGFEELLQPPGVHAGALVQKLVMGGLLHGMKKPAGAGQVIVSP